MAINAIYLFFHHYYATFDILTRNFLVLEINMLRKLKLIFIAYVYLFRMQIDVS